MKFREALLQRQQILGGWMQIGHPACAEIFALAGCQWVGVDLEHGAIDLETTTNIFRTIDGFDCTPVARLPFNDPIWIHRVLDAGAQALIIPMVKTAQEAQRAVQAAKYPPHGERGFGYSRANMHGMDFDDYIANANDRIAMIMQIEHIDAIGNLDAILEVDGVDGAFIGPLDLTGSMGITGQMDHPKTVAALDQFRQTCAKHHKTAGMHIVRPDAQNIAAAVDQGYTLIALGLDNVFLDVAMSSALAAARG